MKFKKLILKNIRSYKYQEIEFPEGSFLLSGDIGSGKTSILLAIEYALFGLQPGQRGTALLRNGAKNGEVSLTMEISGQEVTIERELKRKSKSVSNASAAITIDGERTESSITEIKSIILNLLGYPLEFIKKNNLLYRYTVYTPQEKMKKIITEDSEVRLNILRHVFGIEKYKRIRENLSIVTNHLKEKSKILQGEIKTLDQDKERLKKLKSSTKTLSKNISEMENVLVEKRQTRKKVESDFKDIESQIREKENFRKEAEKTSLMISTKEEILSSLKKETLELESSLSDLQEFNPDEIPQIDSAIKQKQELLDNLNTKIIELNGQIHSLEKENQVNQLKKDRIHSIDVCPTCLQDVSDLHKSNILNAAEKSISSINQKLSIISQKKSEVFEVYEKEKFNLEKLNKRKSELELLISKYEYAKKSRERLKSISNRKQSLEQDVSLLSKHLDSLKQSILEYSKFDNLLKNKQKELQGSLDNEKSTEISIAEFKKELDLTNKEISYMDETISDKENSKLHLAKVLELKDWLSNHFLNLINFTERNVMMKLRQEFSRLFGKWFRMLVPENPFEVHLDESFTPVILQKESEMNYEFLSGGERTALALAYRLALNQTINSVLSQIQTRSIVILDEPTDGFSEIQLDKIRDILEELDAGQLIMVSHEPKIESFVDNVLKLKKTAGSSKIEKNPEQLQK